MTPDLADLLSVAAGLGPDERRTLLVLARRLAEGERRYGRICLATDARTFRTERSEELADLLVYTAFMELAAVAKGEPGA
jgi:hypothetical protein